MGLALLALTAPVSAAPVQLAVLIRRVSQTPLPVLRRFWAQPAGGYDLRQLAILTGGRGVLTFATETEGGFMLTVDPRAVDDAIGYIAKKLGPPNLRPEEEAAIWGDETPTSEQRRGFLAEIAATQDPESRAVGTSWGPVETALLERVPIKPPKEPLPGFGAAALAGAMLASGKGSLLYRTLRFRDGLTYRPEAIVTPTKDGWAVRIAALMAPGAERPDLSTEPLNEADLTRARAVLRAALQRRGPFHPFPYSPGGDPALFRAWVRLWTGKPYSEPAFMDSISAASSANSAFSLVKSSLNSWSRAQRG